MSANRKVIEVTNEEWAEMMRLHKQINCSLAASTTEDLERFSDLFARTLAGKGDQRIILDET
jgi:CO dehydrogenase/acetyl-CoA synthase gamma subunit (corrinoid Fe-S protein)